MTSILLIFVVGLRAAIIQFKKHHAHVFDARTLKILQEEVKQVYNVTLKAVLSDAMTEFATISAIFYGVPHTIAYFLFTFVWRWLYTF